MTTTGSILVVDDEADLCAVYELALVREGYSVDTAGTVAQARELLGKNRYQVMITDMRLPDGLGIELVRMVAEQNRPEKCLVVTAYGSAENAVEALKAGAFDYLTKPVNLKQLRQIVAAVVDVQHDASALKDPVSLSKEAGAPAIKGTSPARQLLGNSAVMNQVRSVIARVAPTMAPVLVHGESGTGKELVARAIHQSSHRAAGAFVAVNCGAIPENLMEAEFFGYRKGAFTGANEDREGLFAAAAAGTLFLDEIGELPLAMQAKLLRVIQERAVRPVGANVEEAIDVRIISATHRNLADDVKQGRFRQDLFYRLNVIELRVPPLRERREDIEEIARYILARISGESGLGQVPVLSAQALDALKHYDFPGNVRELENILQRAVAMCSGGVIQTGDLFLVPMAGMSPVANSPVATDLPQTSLGAMPVQSVAASVTVEDQPVELPSDLGGYMDQIERRILVRALEQHNFNRTAAAAQLGLTLRQIRYRMDRLGIDAPDDKDAS